MFPLIEYENGEHEKTEKALRISETRYLVVTTTWGRIENYIVDCEKVVCDCPNFRKIQENDEEGYICNHIKAVIYEQGPGADILRERLPENWKIKSFDPEVHNIEFDFDVEERFDTS
ncbi:MAG: SWIM zinc finger family protein [Halobacteria archaeon]